MAAKNKVKSSVDCARQVINYSSIELTDRFDKPSFLPEKLLDKLHINSPKIITLLEKIRSLDKQDYNEDKKLYKHFIFSDIKKGYGAKIIASALIAAGYNLIMKQDKSKIIIDKEKLSMKDESKFALLSSTALWNNPIKPENTKEILKIFNKRPDNIHGDECRIIILDSGFKEGVDLFDVKYAHIFEEQMTNADLIQALGRGTRFCGQKGLKFQNRKGWVLHSFIYKLYRPIPRDILKLKFFEQKQPLLEELKKQDKDLNYNINFENEMTNIVKNTAFDKLLNKEINEATSRFQYLMTISKIIVPTMSVVALGALTALKLKNARKAKSLKLITN